MSPVSYDVGIASGITARGVIVPPPLQFHRWGLGLFTHIKTGIFNVSLFSLGSADPDSVQQQCPVGVFNDMSESSDQRLTWRKQKLNQAMRMAKQCCIYE